MLSFCLHHWPPGPVFLLTPPLCSSLQWGLCPGQVRPDSWLPPSHSLLHEGWAFRRPSAWLSLMSLPPVIRESGIASKGLTIFLSFTLVFELDYILPLCVFITVSPPLESKLYRTQELDCLFISMSVVSGTCLTWNKTQISMISMNIVTSK